MNADSRAFIKIRVERAGGSSPDAPPTPCAAGGRVATFPANWRFFGLRGWSKAAREHLEGIRGEEKRRQSQPPRHCGKAPSTRAHSHSAEGRDHAMEDGQEVEVGQHRMDPARDQSARAPPRPHPCSTTPHLFPGDLTQTGVCVSSGDIIPSAVGPATQTEG